MGGKARRKPINPARNLPPPLSTNDGSGVWDDLDDFAPALLMFLSEYSIKASEIFEGNDLQIVDPEDQADFHFYVGYIACAAGLFSVSPMELINRYSKDD